MGFRSQDPTPGPDFSRTIEIFQGMDSCRFLPLKGLPKREIQALLKNRLNTLQNLTPLSDLCFEKTRGNPFYLIQMISDLLDRGDVRQSGEEWIYDLADISAREVCENVADLVIDRIRLLDTKTLMLLKHGACIQRPVPIHVLSATSGFPLEKIEALLWKPVQMMFLEKNGQTYAYAHDKILEAVDRLISPAEKSEIHRRLTTVYRSALSENPSDASVFNLLYHYGFYAHGVTDPDLKKEMVSHYFRVGQESRDQGVYDQALEWFCQGRAHYPGDIWEMDYGLALAFCHQNASCAYLSGNFKAAAVFKQRQCLCLKQGDHEFYGYHTVLFINCLLLSGLPLNEILSQIAREKKVLRQLNCIYGQAILSIQQQALENLQQGVPRPWDLGSGAMGEEESQTQNRSFFFDLTFYRFCTAFFCGNMAAAFAIKQKMDPIIEGEAGTPPYYYYYFMAAIVEINAGKRRKDQKRCLKILKWCAANNPGVYRPKYRIAQGELQRIRGRLDKAQMLLEAAARDLASDSIYEKGLVNEQLGRIFQARNNGPRAEKYLQKAETLFRQWGLKYKHNPDALVVMPGGKNKGILIENPKTFPNLQALAPLAETVFEKMEVNASSAQCPTPKKPDDILRLKSCCSKLKAHMEENRPYVNTDLDLKSLSLALNISQRTISDAVNTCLGQNIQTYVNNYRIEAVKTELRKKENREKTILEIAFEQGFNSKSVFNKSFKKQTGMTPSGYRALSPVLPQNEKADT